MGPKHKKIRPVSSDTQTDTVDASNVQESFSPIKVPESPILQKQGNLTGSARKLKDGAADLHNMMQKWSNLNVDGSNILTDIANIKLECILGQGEETEVTQLPESLLPLCDKLEQVLQHMEKVVRKLTGLSEMSRGVTRLERHNNRRQNCIVLFQTWNLERFESVFSQLAEMYQKELKLKRSIAESVCHARDRNTIMFYSAAWLHQPYIDCDSRLLLESILLETKHKT